MNAETSGSNHTVYTFKKLEANIIFGNEHFIAINKPAGLLSIPDRAQSEPSLKEILQQHFGAIFTVHRIDKDTSGIIIFAKDEATHKFLSRAFEERRVEKFYQGIVTGAPEKQYGIIEAPISEHPIHKGLMVVHRNGKPSVTEYKVIESYNSYSLLQFQLHTGRTHQIRVHCKNMGHPLACDELYGDGKPVLLSALKRKFKLSKHEENERPMLNRLALHSYKLQFNDAKGNEHQLEAPLPKDMRALLQQLKKISYP
ncbi:MAG: RluA family pseudouridine synthase [Bacteroidetes bacterium]|nr:RluA family pseudouridine synthase [Bacteroidota bacterium]